MERQLEHAGRRRSPALMAVAVRYQAPKRRVRIELASGAAFEVPVDAVPELAGATAAQLARVDVDRSGTRLRWRAVRDSVELSVVAMAMHVFQDVLPA